MTETERPLIGAIMKREAAYVAEWVAWHRLQGFGLIVADNCTEGPQTAMLRALAAAGEIARVDARDIAERPQLPAYERIRARAEAEGARILGFLDADEFLEPLGADPWGAARLVAAELARPLVRAAAFRWCCFGSAGETAAGPGLVTERFSRRGPPDARVNRYVKSFARLGAIAGRPLFDSHRLPVAKAFYALDGRRFRRKSPRRPGPWRLARIRHYALKSAEEYALKRAKGDVFYRPGEKPREDSYWDDYDLNAVADPLPEPVLDRLRTETARIAAIAGTAPLPDGAQ